MKRGSLILLLLGLLTSLGLFWHYQELAREFPFDFVWDMDISAAQDTLLLNSDATPAHIDHPKFVMAITQALEAGGLRRSDLLSTASLADLASSPQPMLGLAELTETLRSAHAFTAWLTLMVLVLLLWRLYPAQSGLTLLALPLLGLQAGLLYNALTMRTELYSNLLVALGLLGIQEIWRPGRQPTHWQQKWGVLGMGLLLGLALLNKVQSLTLFCLVPAFAAFCYFRWQEAQDTEPAPPVDSMSWKLFAGVTLLFALMAIAALGVPPLPVRLAPKLDWQDIVSHLPASLSRLKLQAFWLVFLVSGGLAPWLARRLPAKWAWGLSLYPLLPTGTMLAFGLPLFSLLGHSQGLSRGWQYTANMMRSTVWLDGTFLTNGNASNNTISYLWQHRPDLLLFALTAMLLLGLGAWKGPRQHSDLALGAVMVACLLTLVIGNRPLLRDTLWFEVWISWAGLIGLGQLLSNQAQHWQRLIRSLPLLVVAVIAFNSLQLASRERQSLFVYQAPFGNDDAPYDYFLTKSLYLQADNPYAQIFDKAFHENNSLVRQAIVQAQDWRRIRTRIRNPFLNAIVPLRAAGRLDKGFPAWQKAQEWARVEKISPVLQGSILLSLLDIQPQPRSSRFLNQFGSDGFQGDLKAPGAPFLTLVAPFNQTLIVALPEADLKAQNLLLDETAALQVNYRGQLIPYQLFRIEGTETLDQSKLAKLSFPALAIVYTASVQPPELPIWSPDMRNWLGTSP